MLERSVHSNIQGVDLHDMRHFVVQLAKEYFSGVNIPADCYEAMRYVNEFLMEQAPWHKEAFDTIRALDAGQCIPQICKT